MRRYILISISILLLFTGTFNASNAQNQERIQNCIRAHEFIDSRIYYEREQALSAVYFSGGITVLSFWITMGASVLGGSWGGIIRDIGLGSFSLDDHNVSISLIERLYWERTLAALQDLNNCINFS